MAMRINTNTAPIVAQRNLVSNNSIEKISTGYKEDETKDNVIEFNIPEKLRRNISETTKQNNNLNTEAARIQTTQSSLDTINEILFRIKGLDEVSENFFDLQKELINETYNDYVQEINKTIDNTSFGGEKLFKKDNDGTISMKIGDETLSFSLKDISKGNNTNIDSSLGSVNKMMSSLAKQMIKTENSMNSDNDFSLRDTDLNEKVADIDIHKLIASSVIINSHKSLNQQSMMSLLQ